MEEVFADLLRFIYPDADEVYDMERGFEFLDKELAELNPQPDEEKDSRFADKLVKVYHRDGVEEWVLLHVEVQADTHERDAFAERMYTYFYRIRDRYPGRLVSALAIFTGQDGNRMPGRYSYEYRGTKLTYEYPTVSILDYSDEELDRSNNPFAQVIVAIFNFLRNYVLFEKPETYRKFDHLFEQTDKTSVMNTVEYLKAEGREEGIEVGKEQAAAAFVENLLSGSDFPLDKIASLANVSVEFVHEVKSKLNGTK